MRYMMFVVTDPEAEEYVASEDNVEQWVEENDRKGRRVLGDRLRPVEDAKTVRVRGGETIVTDGPFAETKEWIAGFDIVECKDLECKDLDEAIEVAAAHSMARFGRIEVRPFWPFE